MSSEQMRQRPLLSADPNITEWRATETRGATGRDQFSSNRCPPAARRGKLRTPNSAHRTSSLLRSLFWCAPFLLAGLCFWRALPGPRTGSPPSATAATASVMPTGNKAAAPAQKRTLITRPIQDIQVGDWVIAGNPLDDDDLSLGGDVDPDSWQRLELRAPKSDGTFADVVMLRPDWWLGEQQARVGASVDINVPECGIEGDALVLHIGPCPPISARSDARARIVTATFKHQSARVIDLSIEGLNVPIGTTGNHPFWSEDRQEFARADELRVGERLRAFHDTPRVTAIRPRNTPEPVYNLEVEVDHVYHVANSGVLVHNAKPCNLPSIKSISVAIDHIASGHMVGGSRVSPLKTLFPTGWSIRDVQRAVIAAYANAKRIKTQGDRVQVQGKGGGLLIEMWVNIKTKIIETAYPK